MSDSPTVEKTAKPKAAPVAAKGKAQTREYVVLARTDGPEGLTRIVGTFPALTDTGALDAALVANPKLSREATYVAIAARHYTPRTGKIETTTKGLDTITKHRWS